MRYVTHADRGSPALCARGKSQDAAHALRCCEGVRGAHARTLPAIANQLWGAQSREENTTRKVWTKVSKRHFWSTTHISRGVLSVLLTALRARGPTRDRRQGGSACATHPLTAPQRVGRVLGFPRPRAERWGMMTCMRCEILHCRAKAAGAPPRRTHECTVPTPYLPSQKFTGT